METGIEYNDENHEYKVDGKIIPSVTQIIYNIFPVYFTNEFSAKRGKKIHYILEIYDKENKDISDVFTEYYLSGWQKFLSNFKIKFQPNWIEFKLYSQKWGFAGKPDRLVSIEKKPTIIDIKTGVSNCKNYALQTAAYQILVEENLKIKVKNRWLVMLSHGDYKIQIHQNNSDRTAFISTLNLFKWQKGGK